MTLGHRLDADAVKMGPDLNAVRSAALGQGVGRQDGEGDGDGAGDWTWGWISGWDWEGYGAEQGIQ